MRFRRSDRATDTAADAIVVDAELCDSPDLAAVPLSEFALEARRRGFVLLLEGAWEETFGRLEARAVDAEARVAAAAERASNLVDATELWNEVAEYASVHYPNAVEQICELLREKAALEGRADRAEQEVSVLAQALIGEEFPEHTTDDWGSE